MPKFIMEHPVITVDGTDLSSSCNACSVETTYDEVDATGFCSDYREFLQGAGDATITATFFSNFDAGSVDAILWPLSQSGGTFAVVVRAGSQAVSGSNPKFTLTSRLFGYNPIAGAYGDVATTDVTFRNAGTAGLVRGTT